jgi:hypothetical protein
LEPAFGFLRSTGFTLRGFDFAFYLHKVQREIQEKNTQAEACATKTAFAINVIW